MLPVLFGIGADSQPEVHRHGRRADDEIVVRRLAAGADTGKRLPVRAEKFPVALHHVHIRIPQVSSVDEKVGVEAVVAGFTFKDDEHKIAVPDHPLGIALVLLRGVNICPLAFGVLRVKEIDVVIALGQDIDFRRVAVLPGLDKPVEQKKRHNTCRNGHQGDLPGGEHSLAGIALPKLFVDMAVIENKIDTDDDDHQ